jgi:two-component system response regulator AlgR
MDILICDDEPLAVERLVRLVSDLGHQVVATAEHGGKSTIWF